MKPIIAFIICICLFSGCKKNIFESLMFKNKFNCSINGKECYSDDENSHFNSMYVYTYHRELKKFNLQFDNCFINEKESSNIHKLSIGLCTNSWPEIGKEYKMVESGDSSYRYVFVKDACWVSFTYAAPFYNYMDTTFLPKEIRKRNSAVNTKKIDGYIVFDEIDQKRSIFSGRFSFSFEGENSCYPETKVNLTVNNGKFKLNFWNEPVNIGGACFASTQYFWECYEFENKDIIK